MGPSVARILESVLAHARFATLRIVEWGYAVTDPSARGLLNYRWKFTLERFPSLTIPDYTNWEGSICNIVINKSHCRRFLHIYAHA